MCIPSFAVEVCLENPKLAYNTTFCVRFIHVYTHSQKCEMREYEFATSIYYIMAVQLHKSVVLNHSSRKELSENFTQILRTTKCHAIIIKRIYEYNHFDIKGLLQNFIIIVE